MNRLLLTLLALLTGLSVSGGSAEARLRDSAKAEVGALAVLAAKEGVAVATGQAVLRAFGIQHSVESGIARDFAFDAPLVPTILPQIDRARE